MTEKDFCRELAEQINECKYPEDVEVVVYDLIRQYSDIFGEVEETVIEKVSTKIVYKGDINAIH